MNLGPPHSGQPQRPERPFQFRLGELLLFMAAASVFMFVSAPLVRQYDSLVACVLLESIGIGFFATFWWKIRTRQRVEAATLCAVALALTALLLPPVQIAHTSARRMECGYNLKTIGLALHTYHDIHGCFPPAYVADKNGKPMHSWRVLLLPQMDEQEVYKLYNFSEPWDSPSNIRLAPRISHIYGCPCDTNPGLPTQTSYVVVTGRGTMWPGEKSLQLGDIKDAKTDTIAVVEIHNSGIQITEPRDLDINKLPMAINPKSGQGISSEHPQGAQAVFADGSVHFLANSTTRETLLKLLMIDNGVPKDDW